MYDTKYDNGVLVCSIHETPISKQHGRFFCLKCQKPVVHFTIRHDLEWDEYTVEVWINGKLNKAKSYHAIDKDDSIETEQAMIKEAKEFPECYQE